MPLPARADWARRTQARSVSAMATLAASNPRSLAASLLRAAPPSTPLYLLVDEVSRRCKQIGALCQRVHTISRSNGAIVDSSDEWLGCASAVHAEDPLGGWSRPDTTE